jgi:hypothetical protein
LNVIAIGDWEYLHCYRNDDKPTDPTPKTAVGSNIKVYCGLVSLNYLNGKIIEEKDVFCLMVWENDNIVAIYCNESEGKDCYYKDGKNKIQVKHRITEGSPFAVSSGYGYKGNNTYDIHLHLQLTGFKNPYLKYTHQQPSFTINIKEPTAKREISQNKPESQRILVNVNSKNGLDFNKLNLYLFSATKESPTETDLININKSDIIGSFNFAGDVGYPMNNCFPRSIYIKIKEGVDTSVARGSFSRTGVDPNGVGDDDFYYTHLNTKVDQNDSPCDDVLKAKYPDGEYYFFVRAYSILGKIFDQKQQVILNNWTPQIKSLTTNATPDKPLKAGDTVEIKIEFTEQMNTGKTPTVQIWDAKASQWKSLSLSGTAWSNSSDGRIKDAFLKASATLLGRGGTGDDLT